MWFLALPGACLVLIALLAVYVPTIYIRKTDKLLELLQKIAANTQPEKAGETQHLRDAFIKAAS